MASADPGTPPGAEAEGAANASEAKASALRGRLKEPARSAEALAEKRGRLKQVAYTLRDFARSRWRRARRVRLGNEKAE